LPPKKFIELVPFLANNGYRIIIPEIVSYQAAGILASGKNISSLFDNDKFEHTHVILSPLLKDATASSKHKETPNITIRANTGPAKINDFLVSVQKAVDDFGVGWEQKSKKMLREVNKEMLSRRASDDARYKLRDIKQQLGSYSGSDAIISLLETDYKKHSDRNVIVLSDDNGLREKIKRVYPNVNAMTNGQFVYSMVNSKVAAVADLLPPMPAEEMEIKRRESHARVTGKPAIKLNNLHNGEQEYIKSVNSTAFFKSLERLASDLKDKPEEKPRETAINNGGEDRVAKFRAKYAKREQSIGGSPMR